jgi:hypothetical protein
MRGSQNCLEQFWTSHSDGPEGAAGRIARRKSSRPDQFFPRPLSWLESLSPGGLTVQKRQYGTFAGANTGGRDIFWKSVGR